MKVSYFGHACFALEKGNTLLLTDPWLNSEGAFTSSWFQYPYNHHLRDGILNKLKAYDSYIYISHAHKDHCDYDFLRDASPFVEKFILPDYKDQEFYQSFKRTYNSEKLTTLKDAQTLNLGALKATIFLDDGLINEDSAILVSDGNTQLLNLNDCKIHDRLSWIKSEFGKIDVLAAQFSGATWHPHSYIYEPDKEASIANRKKLGKFRATKNAINDSEASAFIPSAGPATFLDPVLSKMVESEVTIFASNQEFETFLHRFETDIHFLSMYPGQFVDISKNTDYTLSPADDIALKHQSMSREAYLDWYRDRVGINFDALNTPSRPLSNLFEDFGREILRRVKLAGIGAGIKQELYLGIQELPDRIWHIDFANITVESIQAADIPDEFYKVTYPAAEVERRLDGRMNWEDLAITFRARAERVPDSYSTYINAFLFVNDEKLASIISYFKEIENRCERINVEVDGTQFEIDRYCPHQGADLKYGWAENGSWICPRHRWEFALEDGGKCKQAKETINAINIMAES